MVLIENNPANGALAHSDTSKLKQASQLANPFYSPAGEEDKDDTYEYSNYKAGPILLGTCIWLILFFSQPFLKSPGSLYVNSLSLTGVTSLILRKRLFSVPRQRLSN